MFRPAPTAEDRAATVAWAPGAALESARAKAAALATDRSGISPPSLLREVKPDYTEDARAHVIEGDVVMEIVVRRDGSVGEVRLLQGLGHGLDARAVQAVREWRFSPGKRHGVPVDVLVEVAMEFKIR